MNVARGNGEELPWNLIWLKAISRMGQPVDGVPGLQTHENRLPFALYRTGLPHADVLLPERLPVLNLLNTRPRATETPSATPYVYQPGLLTPLGRTIRISIRKTFRRPPHNFRISQRWRARRA